MNIPNSNTFRTSITFLRHFACQEISFARNSLIVTYCTTNGVARYTTFITCLARTTHVILIEESGDRTVASKHLLQPRTKIAGANVPFHSSLYDKNLLQYRAKIIGADLPQCTHLVLRSIKPCG